MVYTREKRLFVRTITSIYSSGLFENLDKKYKEIVVDDYK
jgi:hypothetical protein